MVKSLESKTNELSFFEEMFPFSSFANRNYTWKEAFKEEAFKIPLYTGIVIGLAYSIPKIKDIINAWSNSVSL